MPGERVNPEENLTSVSGIIHVEWEGETVYTRQSYMYLNIHVHSKDVGC